MEFQQQQEQESFTGVGLAPKSRAHSYENAAPPPMLSKDIEPEDKEIVNAYKPSVGTPSFPPGHDSVQSPTERGYCPDFNKLSGCQRG